MSHGPTPPIIRPRLIRICRKLRVILLAEDREAKAHKRRNLISLVDVIKMYTRRLGTANRSRVSVRVTKFLSKADLIVLGLTLRVSYVPPFKVTQGHRNGQGLMCYL